MNLCGGLVAVPVCEWVIIGDLVTTGGDGGVAGLPVVEVDVSSSKLMSLANSPLRVLRW